ncbi:cysteine desulfurase [Thiospirochaeta perfilievii]|uniref:Cysteine desulfurase n=1 Tax=Thiospirochaeta perfilievii TaxID=252967 RepID=A0A5C1Q6K9_9SPIO|nr:cysteine desulfurase family protein [Thiospirochaeta perfilievii]QEN03625.1 cysteine desulfurase [Thiospirochaeta perfilievii]
MIYLDWAATAKPKKDILRESLEESLTLYGNPSSVHDTGVSSKEVLNRERDNISKILNCDNSQIYFTSGGSESNNLILLSFLKKHGTGEVITTSIEHPSVGEPIETLNQFGWKIKRINPDTNGIIQCNKVLKSINDKTKIISIIYVHNETGVIQPLKDIVESVRKKENEIGKKVHIHIDGVQAVGKITIDLKDLDIDSFSISGHKFGGPKGIGILYLKKPKNVLYRGGGQEGGIRPGTEDLFGIISISRCLKEATENLDSRVCEINRLMDQLILGVREIGVKTIPKNRGLSDDNFIPNILSLTYPPLPGEVINRVLNSKGFMISTGSACSSNKKSTTKGILSMGISEKEGFSSFRVSIGRDTTEKDIENFIKALEETLNELAP